MFSLFRHVFQNSTLGSNHPGFHWFCRKRSNRTQSKSTTLDRFAPHRIGPCQDDCSICAVSYSRRQRPSATHSPIDARPSRHAARDPTVSDRHEQSLSLRQSWPGSPPSNSSSSRLISSTILLSMPVQTSPQKTSDVCTFFAEIPHTRPNRTTFDWLD